MTTPAAVGRVGAKICLAPIRGVSVAVGKPGQAGDLYIKLNVLIPENLNQEEEKLFMKLRELKNKKVYNQ